MTSLDSSNQPNPHVADQIEAYLAGGLSADERSAFEAHVAGCPGCGVLLEQLRQADSALVEMFANIRPGNRFEDRLIAGLRKTPASRWRSPLKAGVRLSNRPVFRMVLHPTVRRAAFGVAAAVVLAAVGHAAKSALDRETLPGMRHGKQFADLPADLIHWKDRGRDARAVNNLRQAGLAAMMYSNGEARRGDYPRTYFADTAGKAWGLGSNSVMASNFTILKDVTWDKGTTAGGEKTVDLYDAYLLPAGNTAGEPSGGQSRDNIYQPPMHGAPQQSTPQAAATVNAPAEITAHYRGGVVQPPGASPPVVAAGTVAKNGSSYALAPSTSVPGSIGPVASPVPAATPLSTGLGTVPASGTNTFGDGVQLAGATPAPPAATAFFGRNDTYSYQVEGVAGKPVETPQSSSGAKAELGRQVADDQARQTETGQKHNTFAENSAGTAGGGGFGGGGGAGGGGGGGAGGAGLFGTRPGTGMQEGFKPTDLGYRNGRGNGEATQDKAGQPADHSDSSAPGNSVVTRVYDVRDLVVNAPDFKDAPQFDLGSANGKGGVETKDRKGGATAGLFGGAATAEKGKSRDQAVDDLTKLVQETVASDSWRETGGQVGAIKELGGQIVVTQTPENQRQIEHLLQDLRDPKKGDVAAKAGDGPAAEAKPPAVTLGDGTKAAGAPAPESAAPATPAPATPGTDAAPEGPKPEAAAPHEPAPSEHAPEPTPPPAPTKATPPAAPAPPVPTPAELQAQAMQRKIIRNGEMFFDVDSYDSSMMLIGKIAAEEGAFVATTDSEKLPNGKVKGSVIVRCPPERLDTLVLKLRGLGDLKSQRIAAQDITKQYTDLNSQLRAAHAMEDRLLAIIKDGKGAIKDLLEAEKQLGVWREKLEGLEGEIRYYDNLVSLSTLTITLSERDIKTPYATAESEQVSMGVVAEDVDKARIDAIGQIEAAKGRILESDLKKHEAGQFSATIVADVKPDAADPLIDRLKQIGRVARLDRERKQTSEGGTGAPPPGVKIERQDTRLQLSIYNLADVSPRTSTSMNLAAADVEKSYKAIVDQVKAGGGRIISSQLNRPKPDQVTGTITFDVPTEKADVLSAAIRAGVEVMRLDVTENKDSQDVTDAKKGFVLQVFSLASVAPRETTVLQIASKDVPTAFNKLLDAARTAGGRVSTSQLNEQNVASITGTLDFDVPRDNLAKVDAALREAGLTVTRNVSRSPDSESTVDSKVRLQVTLIDEINLAARQTIAQSVAARNVPQAFNKLAEALHDAGARIVASQLNDQDKPTVNAQINFSIEREDAAKAEAAIHDAGLTVVRNVVRSADLQNTVDTKVTYQVTLIDEINLAPRQTIAQSVAARNVPEAFNKLVDTLHDVGARVVTSQLNDQDKPTVNAQINFTVEREVSAKVEAAIHEAGETVVRSVARSADAQNTVDTKVAYQVTIVDQRNLQPRETITELVAVKDVPGRYAKVLEALRLLDAQIYSSQLIEPNKNDVSAVLDFAVRRDPAHAGEVAAVEKSLGDASDIFSRTAVRSQDLTNTVDTKIRYQVTMRDADTQPPRETYTLDVEASDVEKVLADLEAAGLAAGGRAVDSTPSTSRNDKGEPTGRIVLDVPLARAGDIVNAVRDKGRVTATRRTRDDRVPEGNLSRARIEVTIGTGAIMAGEGSLWDPIKTGLRTSATGLLYALQFIIIGLCLIGPFLVGLWIIVRIFRWARRKPAQVPEAPPAEPPGPVPAAG